MKLRDASALAVKLFNLHPSCLVCSADWEKVEPVRAEDEFTGVALICKKGCELSLKAEWVQGS